MFTSAQALRRAGRTAALAAGLLALAAPGLLLSSCNKKPTAPKVPAPTKFLVLSSDRNRSAGNVRTWIANLDNSGTSSFIVNSGASVTERHPSISQDGNLIAYETAPGRGGSHDAIVYRRSPAAVIDDANVNSTLDEVDPYLSLDGQRLAFVRDSTDGARIHLYNLSTHTLIPLPGLEGAAGTNDGQPAMDAAGRRIAFVSDRNGNLDVLVYQVTTGTFLTVAPAASAGNDIEPCLSGDGRYLMWASDKSGGAGGFDVYLYDLDNGLGVPNPANTPGDDRDPTMSFDGSYFAFASNFARPNALGGYDVWNVTLATGTVTQVSGENSAGADFDPVMVWP